MLQLVGESVRMKRIHTWSQNIPQKLLTNSKGKSSNFRVERASKTPPHLMIWAVSPVIRQVTLVPPLGHRHSAGPAPQRMSPKHQSRPFTCPHHDSLGG